jgi:hypothetical protein
MGSIGERLQGLIERDQRRLETPRISQAEGSRAVIAVRKGILVGELDPPLRVATKAA